ncbi:MAG TPA: hypothetical protein VF768_05165 [Holophagaceae bacterium]
MGTVNRREILGRLTALVAGPLLMGRQAMNLAFRSERGTPPEAPPAEEAPRRLAITPPSHSVKRRG